MYLQVAAENKTMERFQQEDEDTLILPWNTNSEVVGAMNDPKLYHAARRFIAGVKSSKKFWLMKTATKLFSSHLLGRYYLDWPSG